VSAYISKRADPTRQGSILGTSQSFASLARMLGPALGGFVYGALGPRAPYVVASIGMAAACLLSLRLPRWFTASATAMPAPPE
jgi:MFS family permease